MRYEHKPVMLEECIASLNIDKDGIYIDGTLGSRPCDGDNQKTG